MRVSRKLRDAGITTLEALCDCTGDELLAILDRVEFLDLVIELRSEGKALAPAPGARLRRVASERDIAMLRLRLIDGLTFREIAARFGVTAEVPRRALRSRFGTLL